MQFHLSSEQQALADAATGLLDNCATKHRAAVVNGDKAFDADCWRRASDELGLPGVAVSERHGGADGTLLDAAVVLEIAGRTLSPLPFWTSIGAGRILASLAEEDRGSALLSEVAAGTAIPSWIGLQPTQLIEASGSADRHLLNGRAMHVVGGAWLEQLLVLAQSDAGPALFHLTTDTDGVVVTAERSLDPTRQLATVTFSDAPATELSQGTLESASLSRVRADIGILLAADQVGTAQGALDMAVEYGKTRHQFGRAIGSFQSLKHLLADAYVDVATARDTMRYGAWALSSHAEGTRPAGNDDVEQTAHLTRAAVTPRAVRVCVSNIQVHGGIGYTWEHGAHLYYKRSLSGAHLMNEVVHDLDSIADAIGLGDPPA